MHTLLFIIGGFMMVLGLGTLIVQDPGKGLGFIFILVLVAIAVAMVVRADDRSPPEAGDQ